MLKKLGFIPAIFMFAGCVGSQQKHLEYDYTSKSLTVVDAFHVDSNTRSYLYAPSVLYDAKTRQYRFFGCGGVAGDFIVYKEAPSFGAFDTSSANWHTSLKPNHDGAFDNDHTCDPNVIQVSDGAIRGYNNGYYLYYGGLNSQEPASSQSTRIGVAHSTDGKNFSRLNAGQPIVELAKGQSKDASAYGIGQPAVAQGPDGKFYMIFTDSPYDNPNSRNVLKVIRSKKPDFIDYDRAWHREISSPLIGGWSVDMAWVPEKEHFLVVANGSTQANKTHVLLRAFKFDLARDTVDNADRELVFSKEIAYNTAFQFGEGLAMVRTGAGTINNITVVGSTIGSRSPQHITGPVRGVKLGIYTTQKHLFRHQELDCPPGFARVAWLGALHAGVGSYNFSLGPQNWAFCSVDDKLAFKHSSIDCPSGYDRIAWLGGLHAGADGYNFTHGPQDWALCSKEGALALKHQSNDCSVGYERVAWLGSLHAGADGYEFTDGPQNWVLCSKTSR